MHCLQIQNRTYFIQWICSPLLVKRWDDTYSSVSDGKRYSQVLSNDRNGSDFEMCYSFNTKQWTKSRNLVISNVIFQKSGPTRGQLRLCTTLRYDIKWEIIQWQLQLGIGDWFNALYCLFVVYLIIIIIIIIGSTVLGGPWLPQFI